MADVQHGDDSRELIVALRKVGNTILIWGDRMVEYVDDSIPGMEMSGTVRVSWTGAQVADVLADLEARAAGSATKR